MLPFLLTYLPLDMEVELSAIIIRPFMENSKYPIELAQLPNR